MEGECSRLLSGSDSESRQPSAVVDDPNVRNRAGSIGNEEVKPAVQGRRGRWQLVEDDDDRKIAASHLASGHPGETAGASAAGAAIEKDTSRLVAGIEEAKHGIKHVTDDFLKAIQEQITRAIPRRYGNSEQPCIIYRVPPEIRSGNREAYEPVAVCIGPFFYDRRGEAGLKQLQDYKWCCVRKLIGKQDLLQEPTRTTVLLRRCFYRLKDLEPRIRGSYSKDIQLDGDDLALMMLLDGCFILHLLLKHARVAQRTSRSRDDDDDRSDDDNDDWTQVRASTSSGDDDDWTQVLGRCSIWGLVTYDLLLLENQIPFFVVRTLLEQLKLDEPDNVLVIGGLHLFSSLYPRSRMSSSSLSCDKVHHLLHLYYLSILPSNPRRTTTKPREVVLPSELPQWIPCAKELEEAGVRFKTRKNSASFLDVEFRGSVMEIPPLHVYDYSECLFRNLIAFEQTYPATRGHVTAYAIFMAFLITAPEDKSLLHLRGVLVNQMKSERDVTSFFSRLCTQVSYSVDRNYLESVLKEVNKYRGFRWPRWRAALMRNYSSNPWVTTSVIAAACLLAMTVPQTFYAMCGYYKPPN